MVYIYIYLHVCRFQEKITFLSDFEISEERTVHPSLPTQQQLSPKHYHQRYVSLIMLLVVCMPLLSFVSVHTSMYIHTCTCMHTYTCMHVQYVYICTCMSTCMYVCIFIYVHVCTVRNMYVYCIYMYVCSVCTCTSLHLCNFDLFYSIIMIIIYVYNLGSSI